ncbi:TetR/AcrR family transcriptional regulator [Actinacidiphila acididurans]|uniref:TetR family transcriptional regulator n=1 Tax=Actinacidiphila acididurans TaxID=2784346 RepID=A0ABS2TMM7_9ACTN|nr:TetR/AcrR family transcriptional regulator [Actinacidiphila acididurans]MBM9504599.1 TetR family transcriptional regulator [Actinacidiphila acididurans]
MRADAQRNYDRLVEEAQQAFIVHGTSAALEDIARHAGVGIGTLYRHFPDRYSLLNAVFERELDDLVQRSVELLAAGTDPATAVIDWLRMVAVHSTSYRGLAAAIMEGDGYQRMQSCKSKLRSAGGTLLWRAQEAGAIRSDVQIGDLLKLTYALVLAAEKNPEEPGLFDRLMSLAVDGMRPRAAATAGVSAGRTAAD